jgi:hypothetical protein
MKVHTLLSNLLTNLKIDIAKTLVEFAIIVDKYPFEKQYSTNYSGRILVVMLRIKDKQNDATIVLYPDRVEELGEAKYVDFRYKHNITAFKKISSNPFYIEGNTEEKEFKGNKYFNYKIRKCESKDLKIIDKIRLKFDIHEPKRDEIVVDKFMLDDIDMENVEE